MDNYTVTSSANLIETCKLIVAQGKQTFKATWPKEKLEFKFFLSLAENTGILRLNEFFKNLSGKT